MSVCNLQVKPLRQAVAAFRPAASTRIGRAVSCRAASSASGRSVDYAEIGKLFGATIAQSAIIGAVTYGLDQVMHMDFFPQEGLAPAVAVWIFFAGLSLRSRIFGFLDSRRPGLKPGESKGFDDRKLPSWCPPKIAFPIVWTSIAVLRATSATMIWQCSGHQLFVLPLLAFAAHLCIGDTWNYINNAQGKKGVAMLFNLAFVWTSAALVDYLYFTVDTRAGLTLLPMNIWLTIAGALVYSIWDLNGREELLPYKSS